MGIKVHLLPPKIIAARQAQHEMRKRQLLRRLDAVRHNPTHYVEHNSIPKQMV